MMREVGTDVELRAARRVRHQAYQKAQPAAEPAAEEATRQFQRGRPSHIMRD